MSHCLAIQHVLIRWTKDDRGAQPGAVRNALPRQAPFAPPGPDGGGWLQSIVFDAGDGYRRAEHWEPLTGQAAPHNPVQTRLDGEHLWIRPVTVRGKPERAHLSGWIVRLPFGSRAELRFNQAFDGHHQRLYEEHAITVGFGASASLDLPLFRAIDERVLLY